VQSILNASLPSRCVTPEEAPFVSDLTAFETIRSPQMPMRTAAEPASRRAKSTTSG
jgi:hypothetical protein